MAFKKKEEKVKLALSSDALKKLKLTLTKYPQAAKLLRYGGVWASVGPPILLPWKQGMGRNRRKESRKPLNLRVVRMPTTPEATNHPTPPIRSSLLKARREISHICKV